jgi:hypothetical protein
MALTCTLRYDGSNSAELPLPAHSKQIDTEDNESAHVTAGGITYTCKHGPTKYRITRKFELCTDAQALAVQQLFVLTGRGRTITYRYTPVGGVAKSVTCRITEPPKVTEVHRNNWEITITFEQDTIPNRLSDPNL